MESKIKLVGPEIKAKTGETVRLVAEFGHVTNACVHERREGVGYQRICDQHTAKLEFDAMVYDNTTDFIVTINDTGQPHLSYEGCNGQVWCPVKVIKDDEPQPEPTPQPTPEPQPQDLGKYLYSIATLSDWHISKNSNEWWDEDDFTRCMKICVDDTNIKCIMSCGDISEASTNAYKKHPEAVCDVDYKELKEMYDVPYWQVAGLRLFSPLGNHDFYGLFESRAGDVITGKENTECISGYNDSVIHRIADLWPTGQGINGIVPSRGRIVFDLEKGKSTPVGQADMNFFSFNDYVDLYCRQGGYTGKSVWDSAKGGISDEAIRCAKQYVNSHWDEVKDKLTMWNDGGSHGRNGYSKLNYWLGKGNAIFPHLSVDYGNDVWPINDKWHDRMIHARHIIDINSDDPYIRRLVEYVKDTGYSEADRPYDYQYYSPNALIWLKELVENNTGKMNILFMHHFVTNRTGNGVGLPKDGNWFYSDVHPSSELDPKEGNIYPIGSNSLTGIEFWFFTKLLNEHKNLLICHGHSHQSSCEENFDNHDYEIVPPSAKNKYVYTKASNTPIAESGWTVALPSMSKPRQIVDGQSVRRYQDAEMGVMEIYEKGVKIKGYRVRKNNQDVNELLVEKDIKLL